MVSGGALLPGFSRMSDRMYQCCRKALQVRKSFVLISSPKVSVESLQARNHFPSLPAYIIYFFAMTVVTLREQVFA